MNPVAMNLLLECSAFSLILFVIFCFGAGIWLICTLFHENESHLDETDKDPYVDVLCVCV